MVRLQRKHPPMGTQMEMWMAAAAQKPSGGSAAQSRRRRQPDERWGHPQHQRVQILARKLFAIRPRGAAAPRLSSRSETK